MTAPTPPIAWLRCPRCERQPVGQVLHDPAQTTAAPHYYGLRCCVRLVASGDTPEAAEAAALSRWYSRWPESDDAVACRREDLQRHHYEVANGLVREGWDK